MSRPPRPTDVELSLLRVLWRLGPATVKQVHQAINLERELSYTGVLRMLQVMFEKKLVVRNESERSHVYAPAHPPAAMREGLVADLMERAFSGSAKDLVLAALKSGRVSEQERSEIQALFRETEQ
ncbi:MAG: BlaI/MecI/CopY family transcriptional regulator [Holophaga sp.]|nr:BlaI/MecI/CopY family transcriptional regulator [Holophaga sp.]